MSTQRYVWAYLWARTASCPNPTCKVEIPLSPNWRLDNNGTGMRVQPLPGHIQLSIVHDQQTCTDCNAKSKECHLSDLYQNQPISNGTVKGAIATCPACGTTTPKGYLAQEAQAGRMGHRLYCVIYRDSWRDLKKDGTERKNNTTCRVFAEPQDRHFENDAHTTAELVRLQEQWDREDILPTEAIPDGNKTKDAIYYGISDWRNMFSPRQQLAHGHCVQAFRQCVDADEDAGHMDNQRRAAWGYVALGLDKVIHYNNLLTRWHPGQSVVAPTFDTHDFGMRWSPVEMAITCLGLGLEWSIKQIDDCLSQILAMTGQSQKADRPPP